MRNPKFNAYTNADLHRYGQIGDMEATLELGVRMLEEDLFDLDDCPECEDCEDCDCYDVECDNENLQNENYDLKEKIDDLKDTIKHLEKDLSEAI